MSKFQDLSGQKFGRLTVIKRAEDHIQTNGQHRTQWLCKCDCGNYTTVRANDLKSGRTTSCGCFRKEKVSTMFKKHGLRNTKLYNTWDKMKRRCFNSNTKDYKHYGARGISICDEWKDDFQNFYDWSMANGYKDNLTIDRINNDGNYEPSNCRWVDMKTQDRNKRNNRLVTLNGETRCLAEWCEIFNVNYGTVRSRLNQLHWSIEKSLTTH